MKIFLIGYMGSGKSTAGKKLAKQLNIDFIDLDEYIEGKEGKAISEIFSTTGEEYFRNIERKYLAELCDKKVDMVISTGGGTPCFSDNIEVMNLSGTTIYLEIDVKSAFNRIKDSGDTRPLIKNMEKAELLSFIDEQLNARKPYYAKAHKKIRALNLNIGELLKLIQ